LLPAPTAPSEGSAGVRNLVRLNPKIQTNPLSILAHQLRRRCPSNSSLRREARSTYQTARPEGSLVLRSFRPGIGTSILANRHSAAQNHPMFGGPSWVDHSCVPLCSPHRQFPTRRSRKRGNRVALEEDRLFRRLLPTDPEKNPKALSTACRRRSDLWSPAAPSCRCRPSGEAGTAVPITLEPCTFGPSRESEKFGKKPVDNGDIGNNAGTFLRVAVRLLEAPRVPTSAKCLNPQP